MIIDTLAPDKLHNSLRYEVFEPGELITVESSSYWLLQQGMVKTCTWTEEGNPITLGYWGPNDLIGSPTSMICLYHVRCITTVKALQVPLSQVGKLSHLILRHVQQSEEFLRILRAENIYQRLRRVLTWLGHKFGQDIEIGQLIDLRLTHQELAELVGATRVTITKVINQLEREGFISRPERNAIVICKAG